MGGEIAQTAVGVDEAGLFLAARTVADQFHDASRRAVPREVEPPMGAANEVSVGGINFSLLVFLAFTAPYRVGLLLERLGEQAQGVGSARDFLERRVGVLHRR